MVWAIDVENIFLGSLSATVALPPPAPISNVGAVVSVRGSVVDIRFCEHLPPIYTMLRAGSEGHIVIEVLSQRDANHVRGIALTPTQGLARGMQVHDSGGPLRAPVGSGILSRMFDVFGNTIDRGPALSGIELRSVHRAPPPLSQRIAVGTPITGRPPHRSVRARFGHTAPTLGG